jgi:hypothetical protein
MPPSSFIWESRHSNSRARKCVRFEATAIATIEPFCTVCAESYFPFQSSEGCSSEYQTRALWKQRCPEKPFEISLQSPKGGIEETTENLCLNGFDLLGSTARQASFSRQVSAPRFQDPQFLVQSVANYHRFLQLQKHIPSQTSVPTYQINLIWHAHVSTLAGRLMKRTTVLRLLELHCTALHCTATTFSMIGSN